MPYITYKAFSSDIGWDARQSLKLFPAAQCIVLKESCFCYLVLIDLVGTILYYKFKVWCLQLWSNYEAGCTLARIIDASNIVYHSIIGLFVAIVKSFTMQTFFWRYMTQIHVQISPHGKIYPLFFLLLWVSHFMWINWNNS